MTKLKEGYKETEIGVIPEEWEWKKLKDLCAKITDGTHKTPNYTDSGVPFLRVTDIQSKCIDWDNVKYISHEEHQELIKRCKPEIGDILYSKNGTIGIPKIVDWDREFSIFVSLCLIKVKEGSVNKKYLEQFLKSDNCMKQIKLRAKQGTVTNLHLEEIRELGITMPNEAEQQRIAEILSTTDEHIEKLDKTIEDYQLLKKGMMKKLLTEGIGHTEFKDTEVGRIPKEWRVLSLDNIGKIKSSKRVYQSDYVEKGIPFYRSKEIIELSKNINPTVELFIDESKYNEFKNRFGAPEEGDLLVTSVGTVGRVWISDGRKFYYKDGNLTQFTAKEGVSINYIYHLFNSDILKKQYLNQSYGSAQVALTIEKLNKLLVPLPVLQEQNHIAGILTELDNRIELYHQERQDFIQLKKTLMEQLLTGKIRVNTPVLEGSL